MKKRIISVILCVLAMLCLTAIFASAYDMGDVDGDGEITSADAREALRASVGLKDLSEEAFIAADVDKSGKIESGDARAILRAAVGLQELHSHAYTAKVTTKATCTKEGVMTYICECGDVEKTEAIAKLAHKEVADAAVAATCTAAGKTAGSHCSVCNTVIKAQTTVPAGHKEVADAAVAATCTTAGKTAGSHCSVCKATIKAQKTVAATGHKSVTVAAAVAPTCTKTGLTAGTRCSVCNATLTTQKTVAATGHKSVTVAAAVAPTCTKTGLTASTRCSVCKETITTQTTVPAKGHTSVTVAAVAPTCTATGLTAGTSCSVCNATLTAQTTVPATGHKSVTVAAAVAPTCTKTGLTAGTRCSVCNVTLTAQTTVPAKGHTSVPVAAVAPTCTETGLEAGARCSVCNVTLIAQTTVAATGHNYIIEELEVEVEGGEGSDPQQTYTYKVKLCSVCREQAPTCAELGYHDFGTPETVAPTCEEQGYTQKTCKEEVCGAVEKYDYVAATGHNYTYTWANPDVTASTCTVAAIRNGICSTCNNEVTETLPLIDHNFDYEFISGTKTEGDVEGTPCHEDYKCTVCGLVTISNEIHQTQPLSAPVPATCTELGTIEMGCIHCDYEVTEVYMEALGHAAEIDLDASRYATCTEDGQMVYHGTCTNEGCGESLEGQVITLPHTGHIESGIQTCTEAVMCTTCGEETKPALGHDMAVKGNWASIDTAHTFYCRRCGVATDTNNAAKISNFNALTSAFKQSNNFKYNTVRFFSKTDSVSDYKKFDFGAWTSMIKDMMAENEMNGTAITYTPVRATNVKNLPLSEDIISKLTANDIDSIAIERLAGLNGANVLSAFDNTYTVGNTTYDLTPYKSISTSASVIKVTIDVKNENIYTITNNNIEETALQKIFNTDIREQVAGYELVNGKFVATESESGDGFEMTMKMTVNTVDTDAKVTYYFLEETYQPIMATYEVWESLDSTVDMTFKIGLSIKGTMQPVIASHDTTAFIFENTVQNLPQ